MSVTSPTLAPPPLVSDTTPQLAATSTTNAKITARRLAIIPSRYLPRRECVGGIVVTRQPARAGSGPHDAPHDVEQEGDVQRAAGDQTRKREGILLRAEAKLHVDDRAGDEREDRRQRSEAAELPRCEQDADRHRYGRLEHHRAGDVPERDDVLSLACPDEAVRGFGELRREWCEGQSDPP